MKRLLWIGELLIIILITMPFLFLPVKTGRLIGLMLYHLWRERRKTALENLRMICSSGEIKGKPERIVKSHFEEFGQSIVEISKVYFGRGGRIFDSIRIKGLENLEKAREKKRGIIFITGHCGNWELLALAASLKVQPLSIVARRLNNPYLNGLIERLRSRYGNTIIYKKGALRQIIRTLRDKGSVGILIDQAVLPDEGIIVDFLGRPAWTTKMPVLIAKKTGSPLLPIFIRRKGAIQEITIHPEVMLSLNNSESLTENMRVLNSFIEDYIKESPEQWLWIHRRWKRIPEDKTI